MAGQARQGGDSKAHHARASSPAGAGARGAKPAKARIAVVSPFVDKRHGTERCLAEQIERLSHDYEIHLFSSRVEDIETSRFAWHRVPEIAGPHLAKYVWWFAANHVWRWREQVKAGEAFPVVYSPGVNCFDANVILVHHVFAEHRQRLREQLRLRFRHFGQWPRLIHRRLLYALIGWLERIVYRPRRAALTAISRAVAAELEQRFRPGETVSVIYHGVDPAAFNPDRCERQRKDARRRFGFRNEEFIVLLIGNDWIKKGLACLIASLAKIGDLPVSALVVGNDSPEPYLDQARRLGIGRSLHFAKATADVSQFYAAADLCAAPSLYDPFGLPVLEAMACGLPVIASRAMGASELVADGENGLILEDPRNAGDLSAMIRRLYENAELRCRLGRAASATTRNFTWDANAERVAGLFEDVLSRNKRSRKAATGKT